MYDLVNGIIVRVKWLKPFFCVNIQLGFVKYKYIYRGNPLNS